MKSGDEIDLNHVIPTLRRGGSNYVEFHEPTGLIRKCLTEVETDVRAAESGLARLGLRSRARVGIVGFTNYQWLIVDLACLAKGFITVPLDPEVPWSKTQLAETFELDLVLTNRVDQADANELLVSFQNICASAPIGGDVIPAIWGQDDSFTVIFTSGTSGEPKAIEVRKRCFDDQFSNALRMFRIDASDTMLIFLPMHIYLERCFIYLSILLGFNVVYAPPRFVVRALKSAGFTFTVGVPHFFASLRELFLAQVNASIRLKLLYELRLLLFRLGFGFLLTEAFAPFRRMLGGKARFFLTGSAPCPLPTLTFFHAMGIPLFDGYGMSEIAGMIALNYPGSTKLGTVGKVFPNKEVAFDTDGQILVRGKNAANTRYWRASKEDNAMTFLPDGWVATGDIGHIDRDGYLTIDGRVKDVIVLSNGLKVQPGPIEAQLNAIPGIDYSVVLGSERPYLIALVSVKEPGFDQSKLTEGLRRINESRPNGERVKRFRVLQDRFTVESGLLNKSLKLNRNFIRDHYAESIEELYVS